MSNQISTHEQIKYFSYYKATTTPPATPMAVAIQSEETESVVV